MIFLMIMTLWAMIQQVFFDWSGFGDADGNLLLFGLGSIILVFALWILLEAFQSLRNDKSDEPKDKAM